MILPCAPALVYGDMSIASRAMSGRGAPVCNEGLVRWFLWGRDVRTIKVFILVPSTVWEHKVVLLGSLDLYMEIKQKHNHTANTRYCRIFPVYMSYIVCDIFAVISIVGYSYASLPIYLSIRAHGMQRLLVIDVEGGKWA